MTSKIVTRKDGTVSPFALTGHAVAALALRVWRLVLAIKHRRELAHLADFDDHMLADIGLMRTDLQDAAELWQDPTSMLARRAAERRVGCRRISVAALRAGAYPLAALGPEAPRRP
jgi:uncharacterized protein YjiS (DUF1127 family)